MTVDPIWRPGGLHEDLAAWLDGVLTPPVYEAALTGHEAAPFVLLMRGTPGRERYGMTGPNMGQLRVRAVSVHQTLPQAWALAELVRQAFAGEGPGRVYTHALTLPGVVVSDRESLDDAAEDVVAGVCQVGESYQITYQRGS